MKTKHYNSNHLIKIQLFLKYSPRQYYWRPRVEHKRWFRKPYVEEAGVYEYWHGKLDKMPENCYLEGETIYMRPHIDLTYADKIVETIYFDSAQDAIREVERIKQQSNCPFYCI